MARPSKVDIFDEKERERQVVIREYDREEALGLLKTIISAYGSYKDSHLDWAISAVDRLRGYYGQ